jgi:AbrB family looped-hinge helix DNA binding protein
MPAQNAGLIDWRIRMNTVTVSTKFQVVIPEKIRQAMGIKPGQKFEVMENEGCLEFVPVKGLKSLRGSLKGLDTKGVREKGDRL